MKTIILPRSKSIAARALIAKRSLGVDTELVNLPDCDDTRELAASLEQYDRRDIPGTSDCYNLGTGGTSLRFFLALAAATPGFSGTIDCSDRLRRRPIAPLIDALRQLGADIIPVNDDGLAPYRVQGKKFAGGAVHVDGSVSSQFISALLLVESLMSAPLQLEFTGDKQVSIPYIYMTRGVISELSHSPQEYCIEADWSAAAFLYEYTLLHPGVEISLPGLMPAGLSLQGDDRAQILFRRAGVETDVDADGNIQIVCHRVRSEKIEVDMCDCPDMIPAYAVGLTFAGIPWRIEGTSTLRHKESDRRSGITEGLAQLGYHVHSGEDYMECDSRRDASWSSDSGVGTIRIDVRADHRLAMAFGVAATIHPSITLSDTTCVTKSFPGFFEALSAL